MNEFTILAGLLLILVIVALAHSTNPIIRFLGLGLLLTLALGLLGIAGGLVWYGLTGPRVSGGLGNWGMLFLALPFGFFGYFAFHFFLISKRHDPATSPHTFNFQTLGRIIRLLFWRR